MKLLQLTATFGCLAGETLTFEEGFNLLHAPNGAGKSTWCAFLRTMLYGLDTKQRDKKGAPADKNRYRPWSGAPMEGLMICEHQGRTIEIRRNSMNGVPMGNFSALDGDTGLPVPGLTAENLGETLTGVSREVFDRSVFLRQTNLAVTQSQDLEKRIAALVSTGEEDVSWTEANETLRAWQRRRRYHKSGLLPQLEQEEEELLETQTRTAQLRQALGQTQARASGLRRQMTHWESRLTMETNKFETVSQQRAAQAAAELEKAQLELDTLRQQLEAQGDPEEEREHWEEAIEEARGEMKSRRRLMTGFVTLVVLLTLASAAVYLIPRYVEPYVPGFPLSVPMLPMVFFAGICGALWLLVLLFGLVKAISDWRSRRELRRLEAALHDHMDQTAEQDRLWEAALARRDHAQKYHEAVSQQGSGPYLPPEAEACRESLHLAEQEVANLSGQLEALGDPVLVDAQLDSVREQMARLQGDYQALEVALEALQEADDHLHARFSPKLSDRAGEYFAQLTQGKYTQVNLSRSMEVTVREGSSLADQPLAYLSQGTADQLYLALRLALADLILPEPGEVPLVLDDALLTLDDSRLALALDTLLDLSRDRQVILFSCQDRESRLLAGQVHTVTLAAASNG